METKIQGIEITSPDKVLYKKEGITKLDVAKYYDEIAPKMLPKMSNRLLSVIRCHGGVDSECFFKKHPTTDRKNIEIFLDKGDEYFYISDAKELVYQAQMGTIEFHIWGSSVPKVDRPNLMVFDLDPSEGLEIKKLRQGVLDLKSILEELGLKPYLKTSGGKGYHVVLPVSSFKDWDSFNSFAKNVALYMESKWPSNYTSNIRKNERKGKIFIDYLRNSKGATCVAPYSLRARENAPISLPISWDNLSEIKPNEVNIKNYKSFLTKKDPWKDMEIFSGLEK